MTPRLPQALLVTGAPGSGKTTLARELATALRLPYVARDDMRGGMLFTAGAWTDRLHDAPTGEAAAEALLRTVEVMLAGGVSCIVEYVMRAHKPEDLDRILVLGDCRVIMTSCTNPMSRFVRRNMTDRLIANRAVLDALGLDSASAHTEAAAERMRTVVDEMRTKFPLPFLEVDTTSGYQPDLDTIIEFVTAD